MSGARLWLLCVHYRNTPDTLDFLARVRPMLAGIGEIRVTDNSASDALAVALAGTGEYVRSAKNVGYLNGARLGFESLAATRPLPEWVLVTNTDLDFAQPDFFQQLLAVPATAGLGAIAPEIEALERIGPWSKRYPQNPFMVRRPTREEMARRAFWFGSHSRYALYAFISGLKLLLSRAVPQAPGQVYAGFGACFILSKRYFEAGGSLAHGTLLFNEELFIAETLSRLRLACEYRPALRVVHRSHAVLSRVPGRRIWQFAKGASDYAMQAFDW